MKWKTKEGKIIQVKNMTNSHLTNAIKYLEKRLNKFSRDTDKYYYGGIQPQGDMAIDCFEAELREREDYTETMLLTINKLKKEQEKRLKGVKCLLSKD